MIFGQRQDAYVFHGTEGSFFKSRSDLQEERLLNGTRPAKEHWSDEPEDEEGRLHYLKDGEQVKERVPTEDGSYYHFFEAVYESVVNGAPHRLRAWMAIEECW